MFFYVTQPPHTNPRTHHFCPITHSDVNFQKRTRIAKNVFKHPETIIVYDYVSFWSFTASLGTIYVLSWHIWTVWCILSQNPSLKHVPEIWWFWWFLRTFLLADRTHTLGFCSTQAYYKTLKYGPDLLKGSMWKSMWKSFKTMKFLEPYTAIDLITDLITDLIKLIGQLSAVLWLLCPCPTLSHIQKRVDIQMWAKYVGKICGQNMSPFFGFSEANFWLLRNQLWLLRSRKWVVIMVFKKVLAGLLKKQHVNLLYTHQTYYPDFSTGWVGSL